MLNPMEICIFTFFSHQTDICSISSINKLYFINHSVFYFILNMDINF